VATVNACRWRIIAAISLLPLLMSGNAQAHHSFAMFDRTRTVLLQGTVKDFQWTNPHAWIQILAEPADNKPESEWSIEAGSINMMARQGWHSSTLKPGDKVAMIVRPLLNGNPGGSLASITLADGRVLGPGGAPAPESGNAPPPQ